MEVGCFCGYVSWCVLVRLFPFVSFLIVLFFGVWCFLFASPPINREISQAGVFGYIFKEERSRISSGNQQGSQYGPGPLSIATFTHKKKTQEARFFNSWRR